MQKRYVPIITETDKKLPYYLIDVGYQWNQEHIVRPNGYFYQWIQCVKGEGELRTSGRFFRVKEGMGMLLFKGVDHEYFAVTPSWVVDWIVFDGHQVEHFLKHTVGITTSAALYVSRPDLLLGRIQNVLEIEQSGNPMKSIQCSSVIYFLLTDILQYASTNPENSSTNLILKLKPLFDYIDQNYNHTLTLEAMAEITGVTPQYLCTVFKKATNTRIFQYIHSVRVKKSKELLLHNPQMQIKEIARLSGFEDANYFCSMFKKLEQISPNQFRKIHLNKNRFT